MTPLFGLPWPLTVAESHTCTATVLVDELDAGGVNEFDAKPLIPEFFG